MPPRGSFTFSNAEALTLHSMLCHLDELERQMKIPVIILNPAFLVFVQFLSRLPMLFLWPDTISRSWNCPHRLPRDSHARISAPMLCIPRPCEVDHAGQSAILVCKAPHIRPVCIRHDVGMI